MDMPRPPRAVAAVAAFVRDRLAEVSDTLIPLWTTRDERAHLVVSQQDGSVVVAARQFATAIVGAAAPFAPTSYSRARLIRQMYASGLLSAEEFRATTTILDAHVVAEAGSDIGADAGDAHGAPR